MVFSFFLVLAVIMVVAQTSLLQVNVLWPAAPDLYFLYLAYLAFRLGVFQSVLLVFALSLMLDAVSGLTPGYYAAFCFISYVLLRMATQRLPIKESVYKTPMIGVCYLVVSAFMHLLLSLALPHAVLGWSWPLMLLRAGLIVVLARPLLATFSFFHRALSNPALLRVTLLRTGNRFR